MPDSFLSRRSMFGVSGALLILLIFFFLLPSAFRGARLAVAGKKNNIKDWLPNDFRETVELDWFAKYFVGESFVVATWDGCTMEDQRLSLLAKKLTQESAGRDLSAAPPDVGRARALADELKLFVEPSAFTNWGGRKEKWFATPAAKYFYITPDGRLYRWKDESNIVAGLTAAIKRRLGSYELEGQFIAALGEPSTPTKANAYYNDPTLLAASLFQSVQTGSDFIDQLAKEGGPLWPVDLTDASERATVAKARAIERLTGTLFAPAVPLDFAWTPDAVRENLPAETQKSLPADFEARVLTAVEMIAKPHGGTIDSLKHISTEDQNQAWAKLCDVISIPVPPRQTCVLATLTPFGKEHLARAVGRGVLGGPRGRMLMLADQSGVAAAPPPSMAPPPFDRPENMLTDASGRPMLRMGGPPVDNVAIDEEGTVTLIRLVGYSGLVGLVLSYVCFRSVKLTIMIFMVGVSSAVLGLATTHWTGGHVDAILMSMPSLVYVSGLSSAIHIVNYYRDEAKTRGVNGAASRAARHALRPCLLAAVTTAIGLFSLCASNLVPISNFGLYAGFAILTTLLILFTYLPAALETFPPSLSDVPKKSKNKSRNNAVEETTAATIVGRDRFSDAWAAVGRWIAMHHAIVTVSFLIIFCICFAGLFQIKTSVQLLKLFDSKSRILSDYAYLEKNFGKLVPMELVVRIPPSMQAEKAEAAKTDDVINAVVTDKQAPDSKPNTHPLRLLERIEAVGRIDTVVRRALGETGTGVIGKTMSAVTFLPPLPEPSNSYTLVRARFQNELSASLESLQETDSFRFEESGPRKGSELWRVSLRVGALSDVDYGQFVDDLRLTVTPVIDAYRAREMILDQVDAWRASKSSREMPRILFVGHREPKRLSEETLLDTNAVNGSTDTKSLIYGNTIYAATIADLMLHEKVKRSVWVDVDSPDAKYRPGDDRWDKLIDAVDFIVMVGDQKKISVDELAKLPKPLVDARLVSLPVAIPTLDENIPVELNAGPLETIYTGIVPVVYKAQRTLLVSLVQSIAMAFVLIAGVMILLLIPGRLPGAFFKPRLLFVGLTAGMIAMVPNLFPIVVVFGLMGHANLLVDIGTMMTASVALGVAVDDTIHFLTWFRQYLDSGLSRVEAVIETYRRVGPAMMQTTFVGGLGLFVFSLSTFTPTQRFGTLMLVLLVTALLGDLILLPAILAGPLGRWFRPRVPVPSGHDAGSSASPANMELAISTTEVASHSNDFYTSKHSKQMGTPAPKAIEKNPVQRSNLSRVTPRRDAE